MYQLLHQICIRAPFYINMFSKIISEEFQSLLLIFVIILIFSVFATQVPGHTYVLGCMVVSLNKVTQIHCLYT